MSQSIAITPKALNLEILEVERRLKPGCVNSSSTNPRCTCPPPLSAGE